MLVKLLVISKLLTFHGAVCNVISCAPQGMSQLVLGRGSCVIQPDSSGGGQEAAAVVQSVEPEAAGGSSEL